MKHLYMQKKAQVLSRDPEKMSAWRVRAYMVRGEAL
jgi:hypothetical protein